MRPGWVMNPCGIALANPVLRRWIPPLALFAFVVATTSGRAVEIWQLDNVRRLGDHEVKVVGAPTVVTADDGKSVRFDGAHDGLFVPAIPIAGAKEFTIEILFRPEEGGPSAQRFFHLQDVSERRAMIETRLDGKGGWWLDTFLRNDPLPNGKALTLIEPKNVHPTNRWYWAALRYADGRLTHFIDGRRELEAEIPFAGFESGTVSLGVRQNLIYWFKGDIREVRFHREALPEHRLQRPKEHGPSAVK